MRHIEFSPPHILRNAIKCFWYNQRDSGTPNSTFEVVPDGYVEIIFYFGSLRCISPANTLQPLPSPFMMGLLNQPAVFAMKDRLEVIAVRCFPWTVFDLLGLSSGNRGIRTFQHPIAALQPGLERALRVGNIPHAISLVEQFFVASTSQIPADSLLHKAGLAMTEANGTLPVSQVAAAAHTTIRTLERKFKQSSGFTVKDVSGLMRFEQVRNRLWLQPDANLADLAYEFEYTDRAHLTREFKRYSGSTPAAFARNARDRKPGPGNDFVAFLQT